MGVVRGVGVLPASGLSLGLGVAVGVGLGDGLGDGVGDASGVGLGDGFGVRIGTRGLGSGDASVGISDSSLVPKRKLPEPET